MPGKDYIGSFTVKSKIACAALCTSSLGEYFTLSTDGKTCDLYGEKGVMGTDNVNYVTWSRGEKYYTMLCYHFLN